MCDSKLYYKIYHTHKTHHPLSIIKLICVGDIVGYHITNTYVVKVKLSNKLLNPCFTWYWVVGE